MRRLVLVLAAGALAVAAPAAALLLRLTLSASVDVDDHSTRVGVVARNAGDFPLKDVRIVAQALGSETAGATVDTLDAGAEQAWNLTLPAPTVRGTFPVVVRMAYSDEKGYALTGLLVHPARTPGAPLPALRLAVDVGRMQPQQPARVRVSLQNLERAAIRPHVTLFVPDELEADDTERTLALDAGATAELAFTVRNHRMLPGSVYQVFAVAEYDHGDVHRTAVGHDGLVIETGEDVRQGIAVLGGAAFLALIGLIAAWRIVARARRPARPAAASGPADPR